MKMHDTYELLNLLPWGLVRFNSNLKVEYSNVASREILHIAAENAITSLEEFKWFNHQGETIPLQNSPVVKCFESGLKISETIVGVQFDSRGGIVWLEVHVLPEFKKGKVKPVQVLLAFNKTTNMFQTQIEKSSENSLRKSEMLLREMGRIASIGGWELDCSTMKQVWTDETYNIHDREQGLYDPNSTEELSRFEDDSKVLIDRAFDAALSYGVPYDLELEMTTVKGNKKWIRAVCSPLLLNGNVSKLTGTVQDISVRKQNEEHLRIVLAKYKTLFDNFPMGITVSDNKGTIIETNSTAEDLLGVSAEVQKQRRLGGDEWQMLRKDGSTMPAEEYPSVRALKEGKKVENVEFGIVKPDHGITWINATATPLPLEDYGVVVTYSDVTSRANAERDLYISEQKYSMLFDKSATPTLVCVFPDCIITQVNEKVEELTGYSKQEMIGKSSMEVEFVKSEEKAMFLEVLDGCDSLSDYELQIVTKSGDTKTVLVNAVHFITEDCHYIITTWLDITSRIMAEEKLHHSLKREQFLDNLIRNASVAVCEVYPEGKLGMSNLAFMELTGYREEELKTLRWTKDLTPPEWIEQELKYWADLEQKKQPVIYEKEILDKSGWRVPVELVVLPFWDADGNVTNFFAFVTDITDRKQAEDAMKENERRLRKTIETTSDGFWIVDTNRRFIEVNESYCTMSGYTRQEFLTMTISDIEVIETIDVTNVRIQKIKAEGGDRFETVHRKKDGGLFDVEVSVNVLDHEQGLMICFCRDITERKLAEKLLIESEQRFATIFEDSPVPIALSRFSDGRIIHVNASTINLLGYTAEEILGKTTMDLNLWAITEDRNRFLELIRTKHQVKDMESTLRLKSGEKRQVLLGGELIELAGETCIMVEFIDITERKIAEQQLLERESELNDAQVLAKMASWKIELVNYQLTVSDNYRKLIGLEDVSTEITLDYFMSRVHPDDVHLMDAQHYLMTPDAAPVSSDFRIVMPDGSFRWFQNAMMGVFIDGLPVAVKGTIIDLTEKKNQEAEIRLQNQKLNSILNSIPDKLFIHNSEGDFLEAYTTNLGGFIVPLEKFIGKNLRDVFPEDVAELNLDYLHKCVKTKGLITHEFSVDYKGQFSHYEVRVVPFMDDMVIRFVRDITEQKEIEKQISKLNKAIEQSPVAILITDVDANITYASKAFEVITGYKKEEVVGKNTRILKSGKNSIKQYTELWDTIMTGGIWEGELINKKKDETLYWEHLTISPLYESGNQISGYLAVKQDVTEKKRNQQEILELNTNLEKKVEDRTHELKIANEELVKTKEVAEEANKAKSIFLANMSHEIRTPLNSIIGFSELLYNTLDDEKKRSQVASIRNSGRSLLKIINDILDLSKVEAGKIIIELEPQNVHKIVTDVCGMFEQKAMEKNLTLSIVSETELTYPLLLDETRLRQILFNLLGNAIKFTAQGSITLLIHHDEIDDTHVNLRITVTDTGIGIPEDQLDAVFEPFVQQQGQTQRKYGGTGLGLAISRRMAEAMGGDVSVKSKPNEGSEFTICLKNVLKSDRLPEEIENAMKEYSTICFEGNSILIVDDIYENRMLLKEVLEPTGALLFEAENGEQAIQLASMEKPDIVLMDIRMPIMDGIEACKILKQLPETAGIPCIAVTASIKLDRLGEEIPACFDGSLYKPVVFDQLFEMLLKYLKHTRRENFYAPMAAEVLEDTDPEWSDELRKCAKLELEPKYNQVKKSQLVDDMEDLGKQLVDVGQRFDNRELLNFGKKIGEYADLFEVDKLGRIMHELERVLNRKLK